MDIYLVPTGMTQASLSRSSNELNDNVAQDMAQRFPKAIYFFAELTSDLDPIQLNDQQAEEMDKMMSDHMYGHDISNSYNSFTCDPRCRKDALKYDVNTILREMQAGVKH